MSRTTSSGGRPAFAGRACGALIVGLLLGLGACDDAARTPSDPAPQVGPARTEGERILDRVVEAERTLRYSGQKRTVHGKPGASRESVVQVTRYANGQSLLEWLEGHRTGESWVYADRTYWLKHPELLRANYVVEEVEGESEPVAWRPTRTIRIASSRPGRPRLELRVDAETWLVLHATRFGFDGSVRLVQFFETIDYDAVSATAMPPPEVEVLGGREPAAQPEPSGWRPLVVGEAPAGFRLVERDLLGCGTYCEYWSDGLAAFRIHQRPHAETDPEGADPPPTEGEVTERTGAGRAMLSGVFHGLEVGVSGNVPAAELETLVRGLQRLR